MKHLFFLLSSLMFSMPLWSQNDSLKISWPEDWKMATYQKTRTEIMMEYIPKKEDINQWSIIGTTIIYIGEARISIEAPVKITFSRAQQNAIHPTLSVIDKNAEGDHPWILFKIEAEGFKNDPQPESQLYYAIEGENDLFLNFVAVKKSNLTKEFIDKWSEIFKTSQFTK